MTEQAETPASVPAPAVDPMKGFRGVMAGTLVLEAIVVALGVLFVSRQYGGVGTTLGIVVSVVAVALIACCWLIRYSWSALVVLALQLVLVLCLIGSVPVGVIGLLFAAIWVYLLWLRRDVARRMAQGRLPSQQPTGPSA
ncbi:MAG TPA: DUF4233 domain-containing protein [Pseudonocardiaceae bacterium]|jgi:hypothetical protein|nr:DUF4233 domain-containing protein [Pseudonocardiaceae bacterium]